MIKNYSTALKAVLQHEGGFVNDPKDPGGATNKGITQKVYDAWRKKQDFPKRSVRLLNDLEINAIYKQDYWDKINGDHLPNGLDYCIFDFAVNSGTSRAAKFLQRVLGALDDGQIGPATLGLIKLMPVKEIIDHLCNDRLAFLKSLDTFEHFGKGWTTRIKEVRAKAKEMAI